MGFSIDGRLWEPKTTGEHAGDWLDRVNAILAENDVRGDDGEIVRLSQNFANALWLMILAGAEEMKDNDQHLQSAINSFNVELCDEEQIENLLPIAAIERNPGSYSTLTLTCTAREDGAAVIPAGTKAAFGSVNFVVQSAAVVSAGDTVRIPTVCDTVGAVVVLAGEITSFTTQIPNLESVVNEQSSSPGSDVETTDSLRRRIIRGETIPYSIDGVAYALENLRGINHARVFFNYYTNAEYTLEGGIVLQPRTAYVVVNGESPELAATFMRYMGVPTQNAPDASPTGTRTTVELYLTAGAGGDAEIPADASFSYDGVVFRADEAATIPEGTSITLGFTATEVGAVIIPPGSVTSLDTPVPYLAAVSNSASVPGLPRTAYEQDYVTYSGQLIPVKYDKAGGLAVFVNVVLEPGEDNDTPQIRNQLKRDLIRSSAAWAIGEAITTVKTSEPFVGITYANVAYTQVSLDGSTWGNRITVPANVIPHVSDSTIIIGSV